MTNREAITQLRIMAYDVWADYEKENPTVMKFQEALVMAISVMEKQEPQEAEKHTAENIDEYISRTELYKKINEGCRNGKTLSPPIDYLNEWIAEIPTADVEPVRKWIPCSERLPEYNETKGANAYWVARKKRSGEWGMWLALYCDYGYAMGIEGIPTKVTWRDWDFRVVENVTHWMELPEPPKMDGGNERQERR